MNTAQDTPIMSFRGSTGPGGVSAATLHPAAMLAGQPFYVYDEGQIGCNVARFLSVPYPYLRIHFASMANDNPTLLRMLQESGIGLFVNSHKHLELALNCRFAPCDIIFASTGISTRTMQRLVDLGITVNVDSPEQLSLYGTLKPGSEVGIRVTVEERSGAGAYHCESSRIGILENQFAEILSIARKFRLQVICTHAYLGTDVRSPAELLRGVDAVLKLSDCFPDLHCVDFGGGFPIGTYGPEFDTYRMSIAERLREYSARRHRTIRLILEPGRAIFGDAASFYAQVTDVKARPDRYLVCVNASASLLPRAMFYQDYHRVSTATVNLEPPFDKPVDVVGNTTYSRDYIARGISLPRVFRGDWLCLHDTGSYCYSMTTRFLGQELPAEYLLRRNGDLEMIRKGEGLPEDSQ